MVRAGNQIMVEDHSRVERSKLYFKVDLSAARVKG